ncbi:TM2 domain-containing protein [Campylobacterota bacterium DY0563]|uniref:TM2 domain-containing protein n=1 Tax=Halarcobacter sp. TaxID=2321133 RepID=UPI0029F503AD|nr:NINE protein [Halarcobacter sp.]
MKGKILDFSLQEGKGIISGDNGTRYDFVISEWKNEKAPAVGQTVDFDMNENSAVSIYLEKAIASGEKSKLAAALLALFLGGFGIHKFYLGCNTAGIIMLLVFLFGFILLGIPSIFIGMIAFIEAILYLIKSEEDFEKIYIDNKKCWF